MLLENKLQTEIIKTLVYFDLFDFPLTAWEIWQFVATKTSYKNIVEELQKQPTLWQEKHGFYYLPQREEILTIRQQRYKLSHFKIKRAKKIAWFFSHLPWVKFIALANIIGPHNLKESGDLDFFIITEKNKVWLTRQFCSTFLKLLNLRPKPNKIKNTICLSFLQDDSQLNLYPLLLKQANDNPDRYFSYWLAGLYPLYNQEKTYQELNKNNFWLKNYLPNQEQHLPHPQQSITTQPNSLLTFLIEKMFGRFEKQAKNFQLKIMNPEIKQIMNKNNNVIINDHVLKLHLIDRREYYYQQYLTNLKKYAPI